MQRFIRQIKIYGLKNHYRHDNLKKLLTWELNPSHPEGDKNSANKNVFGIVK
jgi:hypothetical protein